MFRGSETKIEHRKAEVYIYLKAGKFAMGAEQTALDTLKGTTVPKNEALQGELFL